VAVQAVQQIRKMRGGAQSHLMLGSDGNAWVVKFQNNPQHPRVLPNELLGTRLGELMGLTVPRCEVVEVSAWLIERTAELEMDLGQRRERCRPGMQFGSQLVGGLMPGHMADYLPEEQLLEVRNLREFLGALALDKWTCNANGRQALFSRRGREKRYGATFIDQGFCFNAGDWRFVDAPLRGVYARNAVYREVRGWEDFEPWLTRLEELAPEKVGAIADTIPPEWYEHDRDLLGRLLERLLQRRSRVRDLILAFRESSRQPFPKWERRTSVGGKGLAEAARWDDSVPGRVM
jgi:hypothetical protein